MSIRTLSRLFVSSLAACSMSLSLFAEPINISGVYPNLTMRNDEGECGTGAVVPWQGSLWAITYAPHRPDGSSDKLYEVTKDLQQILFDGSVGGTPANRMIHKESNQLLIGPYLIDGERNIRVIPPAVMRGRLTGNARHLSDPINKVYYATMEEGLYEVDVNTLEVKCLIRDNHDQEGPGIPSKLPGYHGKGLYTGQGRLIYSNNGEANGEAKRDPTITSGALAQWFGEGDWQMVRRNQFTEVSGPGGIEGSANPDSDPVWAMGWDARSLLLGLLEEGKWHYYRLPKGSHSYDGSHGWNTEWPRIREIGEEALLATMHGTFWRFPSDFSKKQSAGLAPRSNYLKVIGDFTRWNDKVVLGCDDSAKAEFLNTRPFKAKHGAPLQSNSNLWFVAPEKLDQLGPVIGRGSVWLRDDVEAGQVSDPYLFSGYDHRQLHLTHDSEEAASFVLELDKEGKDRWSALREITVEPGTADSLIFSKAEKGAWIRIRSVDGAQGVTANFQYRNADTRGEANSDRFDGVAKTDTPSASYGLMRSLAFDRLGLVAASNREGEGARYYELNPEMELVPVDDPAAAQELVKAVRQPTQAVSVDAASVLVVEDGQRYRLPMSPGFSASTALAERSKAPAVLADFLQDSLTLGAAVKVSSQHKDFVPANAVDGQLSDESRWIASNKGDAWIELDLGEEKTLRSLWVVTGWQDDSAYVAKDFDLQTRVAGEWQTLKGGEIRGNQKVQLEIRLQEAVTTRHLRLVSKEVPFLRIYELAAFDEVLDIDRDGMSGFGQARVCREVATERDLLNVHGTFYELPARNAQGMAKIRPVATHNLDVHDFCSHAGLLLFTGVDTETESEHIFRSEDGQAAVWAGVVDDLWELGKPRGVGGPWKETSVKAGVPSDPYLMTAFDQKSVTLSSQGSTTLTLEVDVDGTGLWVPYRSFDLVAGEPLQHAFPEGFSAYWVRAISEADTTATVMFEYR